LQSHALNEDRPDSFQSKSTNQQKSGFMISK